MTRAEWAIVGSIGTGCFLGGAFLLEGQIFSTPPTIVTVTIQQVEGSQENEGSPEYHYRVRLGDGHVAGFVSNHLYAAGSQVGVTSSRGHLTHILRLGDPSILITR